MYATEINKFSEQAVKKSLILKKRPFALLVGGVLAGAYVGMGIILIMTLGTDAPVEFKKIIMGASFGIALTLVMFAGSELFTGYTMYCTIASLKRQLPWMGTVKLCAAIWMANLVGAVLLAIMYKLSGGAIVKSPDTMLQLVAYKKMNSTAIQLVFNGVLCNWLVCLAIWISTRMHSETARCIVIFWCLFAFIACGFEHSVANMTIFSLSLLGPAVEGISIQGAAFNLLWVTLGNCIGGALFIATSYWYMSVPVDTTTSPH